MRSGRAGSRASPFHPPAFILDSTEGGGVEPRTRRPHPLSRRRPRHPRLHLPIHRHVHVPAGARIPRLAGALASRGQAHPFAAPSAQQKSRSSRIGRLEFVVSRSLLRSTRTRSGRSRDRLKNCRNCARRAAWSGELYRVIFARQENSAKADVAAKKATFRPKIGLFFFRRQLRPHRPAPKNREQGGVRRSSSPEASRSAGPFGPPASAGLCLRPAFVVVSYERSPHVDERPDPQHRP